ncbi:DUF6221 family protein [Actinocorallia longicatena]|uniref:Uncharacterized protein n=1 Tax=Actinocorallia longicatena TaxID=111803 RepID=A0ABP6QE10_9ACTN
MKDLIEFLNARLDEDEAAARACPLTDWSVDGPPPEHYAHTSTSSLLLGRAAERTFHHLALPTMHTGASLHHAARHDPARVLRDVAAVRQLIAEYEEADRTTRYPDYDGGQADGLARALHFLAAAYFEHPDYPG